MKLTLLGYGKMGKTIAEIATGRGHAIVSRIDVDNQHEMARLSEADVVIEFSHPDVAANNVQACLQAGVPVVSGTTGWLHRRAEVEAFCRQQNGTFFYASNYSLGVNLFFRLNEKLAALMKGREGYDVSVDEIHHTQKKDAPSGTAITLAEGILKTSTDKKRWVNHPSGQPEDLVIRSFREDPAPGTHRVKYTSAIDDIEIVHTAHTREGFALGAVLVAEWIIGRKGVLTMQDFLPF